MRKKFLTLIILVIALIFVLSLNCNVYAASASISASSVEIEKGTTININASIIEASAWDLEVSTTGGNLIVTEDRAGTTNSGQNENQTVRVGTFSASEAGTYTIKLGGYVVDGNGEVPTKNNVTGSVNVTVKEKEQTTTPTPEQPTTPTEQPEMPSDPEKPTIQTPEITYTNINKKMYVTTTGVYVWKENNNKSAGTKRSLKINEEITVIAIGNNGWYKVSDGYIDGTYLTDTKPNEDNKSSIATLSNITIKSGKLNETFSKDKQNYTMTVEADVDKVDITATPTDNNAKVTITGNTGLKTGTGNVINIKVLAEDGISSKTYSIKVTKLATEDENPNIIEEPNEDVKLGLKSLEIKGIKLTPAFKSDVYEYSATLTDKSIEKLTVDASSLNNKDKVEITGNDEIKDGENVITITVTSENGEKTVTYQVIVTKKEATAVTIPQDETEQSGGNGKIVLVAGAIVAIVALIVVFVIIRKREGKKVNTTNYEGGDYIEKEYSEEENENLGENEEEDIEEFEDDDDDDWGTPKRGFRSKFRKSGRHF